MVSINPMDGNLKSADRKLKMYGYLVSLAGILVFAISFSRVGNYGWKEPAVFILMYFLSQLQPTRLPQGDIFSVTICLDMALIILFGTPFAVVVGFASSMVSRVVAGFFGRKDSVGNILVFASQNTLALGMAGFAYNLVTNRNVAFVISSFVYFFATVFFLSVNNGLDAKTKSRVGWVSVVKMLYLNYAVLALMAFIMTLVYNSTSSESRLFVLVIFFVPILLVTHTFRLFVDIKQSYLNTVRTIAAAIEANDFYTRGHSERVAELALALGKELGLSEKELQKLEYVALLHDVGKIGVPEGILNKPGILSESEYEEVKRHSVVGSEILKKIKFLKPKADIILYHHERYDGTGYPAGLKGDAIPLEARILTIVDAYNAMTTNRPYRSARSPEEALEELLALSGVQFDPELVNRFRVILLKMGEI